MNGLRAAERKETQPGDKAPAGLREYEASVLKNAGLQ